MNPTDALTDFSAFRIAPKESRYSLRYLSVLTRWIHVAMETYEEWPTRPDCGHFFGGVMWYGLETAMPALVLAACVSSAAFSEADAGYSRAELQAVVRKAIRYLLFTHDTGPADCVRPSVSRGRPEPAGTKWGERGKGFFRESQCGIVVAHIFLAASFVHDQLDEEDRRMVAAVAADYLGRFGSLDPRSGVYYDTQTEENAWTALGLTACALALERNADADRWMEHARRWMFCTILRPQDIADPAPFENGKSVSQLAEQRCTTLPDNTAENHGIVHPSYMRSSINLLGMTTVLLRAYGRTVPPHALKGQKEVYGTLKCWCDGSGVPHCPQGMDWPYYDHTAQALTHAMANLNLHDPDGAMFEERMLREIELVSAAHGGRTVTAEAAACCHGPQDPALMRERLALNLAYAYLAHRLLGDGETPSERVDFETRMQGVHLYPHAGIMLHRHQSGVTSISWRNRTMILPSPVEGLHLVGPAQNSLLATIEVEGKSASNAITHLCTRTRAHCGTVLLVEELAESSVERQVLFATLPDGRCVNYERIVSRRSIVVQRQRQGYLSIINDGFFAEHNGLKGRRRVFSADRSREFAGYAETDPVDDEVLELSDWVNVEDRLGIVFKGNGSGIYTNRHYFPVWRAIENDLVLNAVKGPRSFAAGETVCELSFLLSAGQRHEETATSRFDVSRDETGRVTLRVDGFAVVGNFSDQPVKVDIDDRVELWPHEACLLGPDGLSTIL